MFCLDYAIAFSAHYALVWFIPNTFGKHLFGKLQVDPQNETDHQPGAPKIAQSKQEAFSLLHKRPVVSFVTGAAAGLTAALVLYPVDIVRMYTLPSSKSHFALSTIPFMAVYLGTYFWKRPQYTRKQVGDEDDDDSRDTLKKFQWSFVCAALASAFEFPFDHSKHEMAGRKFAAISSALRIPLSACLLLVYDRMTCSVEWVDRTVI